MILVQIQAASLWLQLHANAPGKEAHDGQVLWPLLPLMEFLPPSSSPILPVLLLPLFPSVIMLFKLINN